MAFRILSLDGGGAWSLIQVLTLIDLYRSGGALITGHDVLRDFDLVVANSSGSVVLGALVKDLPVVDIEPWFAALMTNEAMFPPLPRWSAPLRALKRAVGGLAPRYSAVAKLAALRRRLNGGEGEGGIGDLTIDAIKTRLRLPTQLVVTAFDHDQRREVLFRSNPASAAASFGTPAVATLAEAIHASTTAPGGFFDRPAAVSRSRRCWDGSVAGLGNPLLDGLAEALANGIPPGEIQILSLGTGSVALPRARGNEDPATRRLVAERRPAGWRRNLRRLADSILDDPPDTASLTAHLVLGGGVPGGRGTSIGSGRLVRMNPLVQPIRTADGWLRPAGLSEDGPMGDEFVRLSRLPIDAGAGRDLALIRKFCALWHGDAVVNQPIRANSDTLDCEIGQRWYSDAKGRWQALAGSGGTADAALMANTPAAPPAGPTAPAPRPMPGGRLAASKLA